MFVLFLCFFSKYQLHKLPSSLPVNGRIHISGYCLISGEIASHLFSLLFVVQDTINVSRGGGEGKDGREANPKGINRLSCEFQSFISFPALPSSGDRSTDERDDQ